MSEFIGTGGVGIKGCVLWPPRLEHGGSGFSKGPGVVSVCPTEKVLGEAGAAEAPRAEAAAGTSALSPAGRGHTESSMKNRKSGLEAQAATHGRFEKLCMFTSGNDPSCFWPSCWLAAQRLVGDGRDQRRWL